jgi:hypothetical protein
MCYHQDGRFADGANHYCDLSVKREVPAPLSDDLITAANEAADYMSSTSGALDEMARLDQEAGLFDDYPKWVRAEAPITKLDALIACVEAGCWDAARCVINEMEGGD